MSKLNRKPIVDMGAGLESFIEAGDETTQEILESGAPIVAALKRFDAFFREEMWEHSDVYGGFTYLLQSNAYMLLLGGIRVALTGHAAAVFPVLRTAFESACYGLLIERNPSLADVWINRHRSPADLKACRTEFTVARASKVLKDEFGHEPGGIGTMVGDLYDAAIDYGAHPNQKGVTRHTRVLGERSDGLMEVSLTSLHGATAPETSQALVACLDFALAIAMVVTHTSGPPSVATIIKLNELNDLKESVAAGLRSGD